MTASRDRFAPRSGFSVVLVAAAAALPAIASCSPPGRDLQPGRYRAALQTPGGELPFVLQAVRKSQQFKVVAVSGGRLTATIDGGYLRGEVPLTDNFDAAGRWSLTFTGDGSSAMRGVAELHQTFEQVAGTIRTGAFERRVAGEVHGDELRLAHFDGQTGQLYVAKENARGELAGDTWTLAATHLRFVAVRNPDAELEDAPVTDAVAEPEAASP